ncbi:F-box/kelch-repeat protein [Senna tora]|uniref:F-box/kelch-repeat protein n=1 Tax=Senna tora TaxID=362788 RepID=A0A834X407_9FABA|nr:F-box/kelch-repeat protein [Senna tora]
MPILPPELIVEILSWLPVKFLLRFRCVCKYWKSLISDPQFAKKHLRMSTMDTKFTRHNIIFCFAKPRFTVRSCSLDSVCNNLPTSAVKMKYPLKARNRYDLLVGSCNGLLCFAIKQSHVLVWNPSIRISKKSPYLDIQRREGSYTIYGFGYDHLTDKYKVVAIFCYDSDGRGAYKTEVKVYTLGSNSWRRIQEFPSGVPYDDMGKFVSGTLNWLASRTSASRSSFVVISLDLGKESYVELSQPDYEAGVSTLTLGVLRDCLCILSHYGTYSNVWIMKDFGVKESWTKLLRIPYLVYPLSLLCTKDGCISESSEILLQYGSNLHFYDSRNSTFVRPEIQNANGWHDAEVYVESLISPGS